MSAEVRAVYVAYCAYCNEGSGPDDYESEAEDWATEHDAAYHNAPDRSDDADNHRKDSRHD
ncbi:MAG TPA: hypothetical protein VIM08_05840 [Arthrobacter sp.]